MDEQQKEVGDETPINLEEATKIFEENFGEVFLAWQFPEYEKHTRGKWWYLASFLVLLGLLTWSILTLNYLFAIILIIFTFIVTMHHYQEPAVVEFILCKSGVILGKDFYPFEEIENFWIVNDSFFQPKILMRRRNRWKSRIIVPIFEYDPNQVRETLLRFLPENTVDADDSFSDIIGKLLRI